MWVAAGHRLPRQEVPGIEGSDQNGVMLVLSSESIIVWRGRGDAQIVATSIRFPTEEIRLHMHIAIAEQDEINSRFAAADILDALRSLDGPVIAGAFLQFPAVAIEKFRGGRGPASG